MKKIQIVLVPVTTVITLIVNALSGLGKINNTTPQQLSDSYPVFFVPAGYVFSIWGIIYIGLILFSIYQLLPEHRNEEILLKTRKWFILSNIANSTWIFIWHYKQPVLSVLAMLILLISLIVIYLRVNSEKNVSLKKKIMVKVPISIYLGWITVATIANITVGLYVLNWKGFGINGEIWSALLSIIATLIGIRMLSRYNDFVYALVLVWSLWGLNVKFNNIDLIKYSTTLSVVVLIALVTFKRINKQKVT